MYSLLINKLPNLLYDSHWNIFRYITFRAGSALLLSTIITILIMPYYIKWCKKIQNGGQPLREEKLTTHISKIGTPTMGGLVVILIALLNTLIFGDINNKYILILFFISITNLMIGALDDVQKLIKRKNIGISGNFKFIAQCILAFTVVYWANTINNTNFYQNELTIPFLKNITINLGYLYWLFRIFIIVGSSNGVNIMDGLDGLAIIPVILNLLVMTIFCYLIGNKVFSYYLFIHYMPGVGEVCIFLAALIGAGLGFLWHNAKPAAIFMGDTGSLSLGAIIGTTAILIKSEIALGISGFVFVIETLSVILQILYFKYTNGKRLFKMAPIHHHFEKKGLSEVQIVTRFWIIAIITCLVAISTLKLR